MNRKPDTEIIDTLRKEASELVRWSSFASSEFGKYFLSFLDNAALETVEEEDKFNVYDKTEYHILYQLAAVRSKRQTIRAIKKKIVEAESKLKELQVELAKYQ